MRAGLAFIAGAAWVALLCSAPVALAQAEAAPPVPDSVLAPVLAAATPPAAPPVTALAASAVGSETGLPLPRYVSLKTSRGRARRGPSDTHRVDWIYTRRDMPLRVTGEFEHWRRIEDAEGQGGWIHYSLLSGVRTVLVTQDMAPMRARPATTGTPLAYLEAGVVARILECNRDWCRLNAEGTRGWVGRSGLWGLEADEVLD